MSDRKFRGIFHKIIQGKGYKIVEFLIGIILLVMGSLKSLDISLGEETKVYDGMTPCIYIAAERYGMNIDVGCYVKDGGEVILTLDAGEQLDEDVRVWILVTSYEKPFHWETSEGIDHVILERSFDDDKILEEECTLPAYYAYLHNYVSQKTGSLQGMSREYISHINDVTFTTTVKSRGENEYIRFQMEAEDAELRRRGDIIINMPWISSWRNAPAYYMDIDDLKELGESDNIYSLFYNCMIDGKAVWTPKIHVFGSYEGDYCIKSDYVVSKVIPAPKYIESSIVWREDEQWVPSLVFYDMNYDKIIANRSWLGGILIAVGSGMVVISLSEWLK